MCLTSRTPLPLVANTHLVCLSHRRKKLGIGLPTAPWARGRGSPLLVGCEVFAGKPCPPNAEMPDVEGAWWSAGGGCCEQGGAGH